jgi:hypothetical protein
MNIHAHFSSNLFCGFEEAFSLNKEIKTYTFDKFNINYQKHIRK